MNDQHKARVIRAKKLGVLMREARLASGRTLAECADRLGISTETLEAYEFGQQAPALPDLESLARLLGMPVAHFWGEQTLAAQGVTRSSSLAEPARRLRQHKIGALLRQARLEKGLALAELAGQTALDEAQVEAYELGQAPVSLTDLQALATALDCPLSTFTAGAESAPAYSQADAEFMALPPELRAFITRPVNRPYLEIALRLSEMPAGQLRAIAEGLLAITY